jgi:endo-1,4-beta-xylanase
VFYFPASTLRAFYLASGLSLLGCAGAQQSTAAPSPANHAADASRNPLETPGLAAHYVSKFPIGVALEPTYLDELGALVAKNFNHLTAENVMKCERIQPKEGEYDFSPADQLAEFARAHSMRMTGHALVWYRETPDWLVTGAAPDVSSKLRQHILTVVARYADVTDNWDVVNEAISDTAGKQYRDGAEGSKLFPVLGPGFITQAFQNAEEAAKLSGKAIDLYYNDYNLDQPEKRAKVLQMVAELRAQGVRIDGIGEQAHWNLNWPPVSHIQAMIDAFVSAGLKVKFSELDISIYTNEDWDRKVWEPEKPFTQALAERQAARFKELFGLFLRNAAHISSVTLWGVSDDRTWLDTWPAPGRNNHPLLFDDNDQPKAAYFALFEL